MTLRTRLAAGDVLVGSFLKTPAPQLVEVLGLSGLDFVVADMEHAPIDLRDLDLIAMAGRAVDLPVLVRSRGSSAEAIWPALDLGCTGVMVPHIRNPASARAAVAAARFSAGQRGCSPSGRAGFYGGLPPVCFRDTSDQETLVIAQIEDEEALANLDTIAIEPGIDALFLGPVDLAQSLGCAPDAPEIRAAGEKIVRAAALANKAAGTFVPYSPAIRDAVASGMRLIVCGSDQSLLRTTATNMITEIDIHQEPPT
ncbi:HpcH/HpaI aldolase family protein [Nitratireductor pacificus]|uniref:HpcH/HpaI aldolase n=1 Tax=Nitratireductor pacificus pht-3B TaxID=391937 RepID=K2M8U9_9HYPH|nr:aldolase/citrate lyase family protein [Nitratireductor pacificus]EKF18556.1 HpcH/HpaI aldolase [Nitratireductor pacificus pht-3B]